MRAARLLFYGLLISLFPLAADRPYSDEGAVLDSSREGVQILRRDLRYNDRRAGYEYWVRNNRPHPIVVTIVLVDATNVRDQLSTRHGGVEVPAHGTVYLGRIVENDPQRSPRWNYSWSYQVLQQSTSSSQGAHLQ